MPKTKKPLIERLKNLFTKIDEYIEKLGNPAYKIVSVVYAAIQRPGVIAFVAFTKTKLDDKALALLLQYLPIAIKELGLIIDYDDDQDLMDKFVAHLKDKNKPYVDALLLKTGSLIIGKMREGMPKPDKKLMAQSSDTLMQLTWESNQV